MTNKRINLALFDIDGCVFHGRDKSKNGKNIKSWLIEHNPHLLEYIANYVKEQKFDELLLSLGSNRGDERCDTYEGNSDNRGAHGSCVPVLPLLQSYFQKLLENCKVLLEPFMMGDIYSKKNAVEVYAKIQKQLHGEKISDHPVYLFDATKISLIYANAHRIASFYKDDEIVIDFYDDNNPILRGLYNFFSKNPSLLPKNVTLNLKQYDGGLVMDNYMTVRGTGKIDEHYDWSTRYLTVATLLPHAPSTIEFGNFYEQTVIQDENFLWEAQIDNYDSFNLNAFNQFRDSVASQLSERKGITETKSYTTAEELQQNGLITTAQIITPEAPKPTASTAPTSAEGQQATTTSFFSGMQHYSFYARNWAGKVGERLAQLLPNPSSVSSASNNDM